MKTKFRRIIHRLFFTLLAAGTLIALFYAEEDWRGARVWAAAKRDLAAKGESLEFKTFIPPPIPDDQNLAMAPLFVRAFRYQPEPANGVLTFEPYKPGEENPELKELDSMIFGPKPPKDSHYPKSNANWSNGHHRDLAAWQTLYRENPALPHTSQPQSPSADVLLALSRYEPLLDELSRAAAERPLTRFPIDWTLHPAVNIRLPHAYSLQVIVSALSLRASASLVSGNVTAARQDLTLALRMTRSLSDEPLLISSLVEANCLETLLQPLWEGLEARQWSAADLAALQDKLGGFNVLPHLHASLRAEHAGMFIQTVEDLQNPALARGLPKLIGVDLSNPPPDTYWGAVRWTLGLPKSLEQALWESLPYWPRGWFDQNAATASRWFQQDLIDRFDPAVEMVHLAANGDDHRRLDRLPLWPGTFLTKNLLPATSFLLSRMARAQATLTQGVTALALERYYQDHQTYPAVLAALVPTYLDRVRVDPFDGAPMRYRLTVDGRFQLWSVGPDQKDNGGSLEWPPNRSWRRGDGVTGKGGFSFPTEERDKADYVWQYAPAEPPDPPANTSRLGSLP